VTSFLYASRSPHRRRGSADSRRALSRPRCSTFLISSPDASDETVFQRGRPSFRAFATKLPPNSFSQNLFFPGHRFAFFLRPCGAATSFGTRGSLSSSDGNFVIVPFLASSFSPLRSCSRADVVIEESGDPSCWFFPTWTALVFFFLRTFPFLSFYATSPCRILPHSRSPRSFLFPLTP